MVLTGLFLESFSCSSSYSALHFEEENGYDDEYEQIGVKGEAIALSRTSQNQNGLRRTLGTS